MCMCTVYMYSVCVQVYTEHSIVYNVQLFEDDLGRSLVRITP